MVERSHKDRAKIWEVCEKRIIEKLTKECGKVGCIVGIVVLLKTIQQYNNTNNTNNTTI